MVVTGTFYGIEQSNTYQDIIASFIISLCGTIPVFIIRKLFEKSKSVEVKSIKHDMDDILTRLTSNSIRDQSPLSPQSLQLSTSPQSPQTPQTPSASPGMSPKYSLTPTTPRYTLAIRKMTKTISKIGIFNLAIKDIHRNEDDSKIKVVSDVRKSLFNQTHPFPNKCKRYTWILLILWTIAAAIIAVAYGLLFDAPYSKRYNKNIDNYGLYQRPCWNNSMALQMEYNVSLIDFNSKQQILMNEYGNTYAGNETQSWLLSIFQSLITSLILWQPLMTYVLTWIKLWLFTWHLKMNISPMNLCKLCIRCCCGCCRKQNDIGYEKMKYKVTAHENRPVDIISFLSNDQLCINDMDTIADDDSAETDGNKQSDKTLLTIQESNEFDEEEVLDGVDDDNDDFISKRVVDLVIDKNLIRMSNGDNAQHNEIEMQQIKSTSESNDAHENDANDMNKWSKLKSQSVDAVVDNTDNVTNDDILKLPSDAITKQTSFERNIQNKLVEEDVLMDDIINDMNGDTGKDNDDDMKTVDEDILEEIFASEIKESDNNIQMKKDDEQIDKQLLNDSVCNDDVEDNVTHNDKDIELQNETNIIENKETTTHINDITVVDQKDGTHKEQIDDHSNKAVKDLNNMNETNVAIELQHVKDINDNGIDNIDNPQNEEMDNQSTSDNVLEMKSINIVIDINETDNDIQSQNESYNRIENTDEQREETDNELINNNEKNDIKLQKDTIISEHAQNVLHNDTIESENITKSLDENAYITVDILDNKQTNEIINDSNKDTENDEVKLEINNTNEMLETNETDHEFIDSNSTIHKNEDVENKTDINAIEDNEMDEMSQEINNNSTEIANNMNKIGDKPKMLQQNENNDNGIDTIDISDNSNQLAEELTIDAIEDIEKETAVNINVIEDKNMDKMTQDTNDEHKEAENNDNKRNESLKWNKMKSKSIHNVRVSDKISVFEQDDEDDDINNAQQIGKVHWELQINTIVDKWEKSKSKSIRNVNVEDKISMFNKPTTNNTKFKETNNDSDIDSDSMNTDSEIESNKTESNELPSINPTDTKQHEIEDDNNEINAVPTVRSDNNDSIGDVKVGDKVSMFEKPQSNILFDEEEKLYSDNEYDSDNDNIQQKNNENAVFAELLKKMKDKEKGKDAAISVDNNQKSKPIIRESIKHVRVDDIAKKIIANHTEKNDVSKQNKWRVSHRESMRHFRIQSKLNMFEHVKNNNNPTSMLNKAKRKKKKRKKKVMNIENTIHENQNEEANDI